MDKVVVIGATGTIGQAAVAALGARHDVIQVGATRGTYQVDATKPDSIAQLFKTIGKVDHVITAMGTVHFGALHETTVDQFWLGLRDKLMGQINAVLLGQPWVHDEGSFTLTSGVSAHEPIPNGANASSVNLALEGFIMGAALDLKRGQRINLVSPTVLESSVAAFGPYFPGFAPVSEHLVGLAYVRSVEGGDTGRVYRVGY